ncbi:HSF-type DNA-binding protein [Nitzschia inconspicua]|uniref:HSF-type DNA-binding protein n=1 Tax=Nitzschia inconspicua TaxID=303405 RepID=A0A9K3Q0X5_9STRA|nr:HSF-type DNA-binding protein [Nitzschia inconspicua]
MMEDHFPSDDSTNADQKNSKEARQPFPVKVYEMLEDADPKNFAHIVSWNPQGNGFMVHKKDLFIHEIVPQYFNQTKYKSFQRQLSLYGFNRVTVGSNKGLRYHEKLRRGRFDLVCHMKPVGYKPRGTTAKIIMEHQPNELRDNSPSPVSSSAPALIFRPGASTPMSVVGASSEVIPTVISSGSVDKLCSITPDQINAVLKRNHARLVSPSMVSEGEDSSSSDDLPLRENELQDLLERGLFEGMGFYLTMPTQQALQDFLPAFSLPLALDAENAPLPPPCVMDVELKEAWQRGYSMALSIKASPDINSDSKEERKQSKTAVTSLPYSPRLLLDDCVDALDFHAADIAASGRTEH